MIGAVASSSWGLSTDLLVIEGTPAPCSGLGQEPLGGSGFGDGFPEVRRDGTTPERSGVVVASHFFDKPLAREPQEDVSGDRCPHTAPAVLANDSANRCGEPARTSTQPAIAPSTRTMKG